MQRKKYIIFILMFMALPVFSAGCNKEVQTRNIEVLRIGLIPDQSGDKTYEQYKAIFDSFSKRTDIPYEYVDVSSYGDVLEKFQNQEIDFGYFGAVTYLKARENAGAVPLVMRDVDMEFTSHFLVPASSNAKTVKDLKGKRLAFGSKLSTSGHFMPRHFMQQDGIKPEEFFGKVIFSGAHDKTAFLVRDGKADLGVLNSQVAKKLFKTGKIKEEQVRVLKISPPYPDYVWAVQPYMKEDLRLVLQQTFTELLPHAEKDKKILNKTGAGFFLPASPGDFQQLEIIIKSVEESGS